MSICIYLLNTRDKGMIYRPDTSGGIEGYVDDDFQVDGKMVITNLRNQYYHAQVLLLCILDSQFIGEKEFKQKFTSVIRKAITLLCQPQYEN